MPEETTTIPLIRTKLHRPPVASDHIHRPRLLERLDQRRQRPLTLVSAPAGYGKSTLVSWWLEAGDIPSGWLSLDESDNDLRLFLSYFLAAVQTIFPDVGHETQAMLSGADLPPLSVLASSLVNELDRIEDDFILVLDDYHVIQEQAVHDLTIELLKHPPQPLHLVLASRRDPPLPLASLRARAQMTEIRVQDLRFTVAETAAFLQQMMGAPVEDAEVAVLEEKTEGWVTGLRLAALSLRHRSDLDRILANLPEDNRYVMDYLLTEVLSNQAENSRDYLLATAILNRFCAPLCDAVCVAGTQSWECKMGGQEFLEWLGQSDLFVIPLDDEHRWFRYHHLFQQLLQRRLERRFSPDDIDVLHKRASSWFAENGLIEEALYHDLEGGDIEAAARLVAQHRHELMNKEEWHQLERWLRLFPAEIVEKRPDLLLLRVWLGYYHWYSLAGVAHDLALAEALVSGMPAEATEVDQVMSEVAAVQSGLLYWATDGVGAVTKAQQALESSPREHECVRSTALLHLGGAYQIIGENGETERVLWEALQDEAFHHHSSHARLMLSLCFVYWCEADLRHTHQTATQFLKLGLEHNLPASTSYARYFLGIVHYDRNELDAAEEQLRIVVDNPYLYPIHNVANSAFPLSLIYLAQGRLEEALDIASSISSLALERRNTHFMKIADAFQAELDLRQGRIAEADQWARQFKPSELRQFHRFFAPELTWVKVLLACGTTDGQQKADTFLRRLYDFQVRTHNTNWLIDVLAVQALLYDAKGDEAEALSALEQAITLARPGGYIRPFLDLGPKMAELLNRLAKQNIAVKYVGKLLAGFRNEGTGYVQTEEDDKIVAPLAFMDQPLDEHLSNREFEILSLLTQRLSNKEIAEKLFISPDTVKKHLYNIYQKLSVNSRREAVDKANALGMLSSH
jgi:LuxR family maltose regulon positive regulatory protein